MNCTIFPLRRSIPLLALALTLAITSCEHDNGLETATVHAPSPAANLLAAPGPRFPPLEPGNYEYIAILANDEDPNYVAAKNELIILHFLPLTRVLHFTSRKPLHELVHDRSFSKIEFNDTLVLGRSSNLLMGFTEGDWTDDDYVEQDELACMRLEAVHQHARGGGVRVGVIDTGIDVLHPYFLNRIEAEFDRFLGSPEEYSDGIDDDGDGVVDAGYGHGTHVAGLILTLAPNVTIYPFRAIDEEGYGTEYTVAAGFEASLRSEVDVVNLSLSMEAFSPVLSQILTQVDEAGIVVVAAAGNNTPNQQPTFPANMPTVYGVAATSSDGVVAPFSAYDGTSIEFAAVGTDLISSFPGAAPGEARLARASGTSAACAVVTGSISLMLGKILPIPAEDGLELLETKTEPVSPAGSVRLGFVSPYEALELGP